MGNTPHATTHPFKQGLERKRNKVMCLNVVLLTPNCLHATLSENGLQAAVWNEYRAR